MDLVGAALDNRGADDWADADVDMARQRDLALNQQEFRNLLRKTKLTTTSGASQGYRMGSGNA